MSCLPPLPPPPLPTVCPTPSSLLPAPPCSSSPLPPLAALWGPLRWSFLLPFLLAVWYLQCIVERYLTLGCSLAPVSGIRPWECFLVSFRF